MSIITSILKIKTTWDRYRKTERTLHHPTTGGTGTASVWGGDIIEYREQLWWGGEIHSFTESGIWITQLTRSGRVLLQSSGKTLDESLSHLMESLARFLPQA